MAFQNTPLGWSWEHVWGHQDDKKMLTVTKQQNIDMDTAAKEHWHQYYTQCHGTPLQFHREGWRIFLGQKNKHKPEKSPAGPYCGESSQGVLGWEDMLPQHRCQPSGLEHNQKGCKKSNDQHALTAKFTTSFCATGHKMVQMKKDKQLIVPNVDIPTKTPITSYNVPTQNPSHYGTLQ